MKDLSGFHKLDAKGRIELIKKVANLTDEDVKNLQLTGALDLPTASRMIENVIGTFELPFGIATNFLINGKEYLIPMVLEEPSVVAAASKSAKIAKASGGFKASSDESVMIGQVQLVGIKNPEEARKNILSKKEELLSIANEKDPVLIKYGGGAKDIELRTIDTPKGKNIVVHLLVNVSDVMGANVVNTMCEAISQKLEELSGGKTRLRIVSNLAIKRLARAEAKWTKKSLESSFSTGDMKGGEIVDAVLDAYNFAVNDQYRCTTHNKGIMNGIDAVCIATGNDFRAVEAGAHSYASLGGYKPLTSYKKDKNGNIRGRIELPLAVGIVGGSIRTNPLAQISLKILGVKSARELAEVMVSVGLAQNFAALRALATEGIQKGHLRLHAKNFAVMAGAKGDIIDKIAAKMINENNISHSRAVEILNEFKENL